MNMFNFSIFDSQLLQFIRKISSKFIIAFKWAINQVNAFQTMDWE